METRHKDTPLGMGDFCEAVGYSDSTIRKLEMMGVVKPTRTRSGWRVFTSADVAAVKAWRTPTSMRR
jgi:DNA-binding transcriptional MerR regulator